MSTAQFTGEKAAGSDRKESFVSEALWLAKEDIRRSWLSYPASGLFMLFFGLLAVPTVYASSWSAGPGSEGFTPFFADYFFVIMSCLFVVNVMSADYIKVWTSDVFSERTAFLRSLPLSTGTLVGSRAVSMLFAVPFTVPAFFLPSYFLTDLGELGFSYVWFVGVWLGWAILYAGVTILCELGLSGRVYCWLSFAIVAAMIAVILVIESVLGVSLVGGSLALVERFGPLSALVSVLIGAVGFWLLAKLTVRRVQTREVGA